MKMMITIKQNKGTKQKKIEESERKKKIHTLKMESHELKRRTVCDCMCVCYFK